MEVCLFEAADASRGADIRAGDHLRHTEEVELWFGGKSRTLHLRFFLFVCFFGDVFLNQIIFQSSRWHLELLLTAINLAVCGGSGGTVSEKKPRGRKRKKEEPHDLSAYRYCVEVEWPAWVSCTRFGPIVWHSVDLFAGSWFHLVSVFYKLLTVELIFSLQCVPCLAVAELVTFPGHCAVVFPDRE